MEQGLLQSIERHRVDVLKYESNLFQDKVLTKVPLAPLTDAAEKKGNSQNLTFHEHFIKEVMNWFKHSYFRWVDCKPCDKIGCSGTTHNTESLQPTAEDLSYGASRVECHKCSSCGSVQRFPRYNCPSKLLDTAEGRCGEWANCFTGICRALGYEARYIYDVTDHVWTEVYSQHLNKWVHIDPCENAWDRPLVYEQGWKKKLSYVIAFSKDEVVDVTYKYSINHADVRSRRPGEGLVADKIKELNSRYKHSPDKQAVLNKRLAKELVEMMTQSVVPEDVYEGRVSGSTEWRQGRGEGGTTAPRSDSTTIQCTADSTYTLQYNPGLDAYTQLTDADKKEYKSWRSLIFSVENVFKKVEYDWNMVYLARKSNDSASIEWRIECTKPIKVADIELSHTTFHDGVVSWFCGGLQDDVIYQPDLDNVNSRLVGKTSVKIIAQLANCSAGGETWQHTQLFRINLNDTHLQPFSVKLEF